MARTLSNFTACPLLGPQRHAQIKEYDTRRCVKMMHHSSQAPVLRLQSFSGLRASNALDLMARPCQDDLFSKVKLSSISSRKGKASRCVTKALFEQCTIEAIIVVVRAQTEARRLGHDRVGTELLLLALIAEATGITARFLKYMGINLRDARLEVEKIIGRGDRTLPAETIPFTHRAKRALELSLEEARELGHNSIGPEHILVGLLLEGKSEGDAARLLGNLSLK